MARTKTRSFSTAQKDKPKGKKKTAKSKKPQSSLRSPGKRLTVKQLFERRKFILDTLGEANKDHYEEKNLYLTSTGSPKEVKKKIRFDKIIRYSTGEQLIIDLSDGDSAKKLMNLPSRTPVPDPVEKRVTRNKRKSDSTDPEEQPILKKNKIQKSPKQK